MPELHTYDPKMGTKRRALACVIVAACGGSSGDSIDAPQVDAALDAPDAPGAVDLATRVQACAVAGACGLVVDLEQCLFLLDAFAPDTRVSCLASATAADCVAARACFGYRVSTDASCVPGCADADTLVQCIENRRAETDCPASIYALGDACITNEGRSDCGGAACSNDGMSTCAGTMSSTCDSGITETTDCADRGLICESATGRCTGVGSGSCAVGTPTSCDGDTIVKCDANGVVRRQDCAVMNRTCVDGQSDKICGYGNECPASELPTCVGTVLAGCFDGVRKSIDCTTIGATQCIGGGTRMARCTP